MLAVVATGLILVVAGCHSRAAPISVVDPPTPIHMTARELYLNYDSSSRVIPARYSIWDETTRVEEWTDLVVPGTTYVMPVPIGEGKPTVELVDATKQPNGDLLLGTTKIALEVDKDLNATRTTALIPDIVLKTIRDGKTTRTTTMVVEDTTYHLAEVKFWLIKVEPQKLPADKLVVLHCYWQVRDITGQSVTWHLYYCLER